MQVIQDFVLLFGSLHFLVCSVANTMEGSSRMPSLTSYGMYNIVSCACFHFLRFFFCSIDEAFEDLLQAHRLVSQH